MWLAFLYILSFDDVMIVIHAHKISDVGEFSLIANCILISEVIDSVRLAVCRLIESQDIILFQEQIFFVKNMTISTNRASI